MFVTCEKTLLLPEGDVYVGKLATAEATGSLYFRWVQLLSEAIKGRCAGVNFVCLLRLNNR